MNRFLNRKPLEMFCKFLLSASISLVWMKGHVGVGILEPETLSIISSNINSLGQSIQLCSQIVFNEGKGFQKNVYL